ncbi:MAG: hypothetical protein Q8N37_02635 [bacterium]|nr:hypothetical protein [bacterium]
MLIFKAKTGRKWENHALYNLEDAKERMLAFEKMLELIRKRMKIIEMNVMEEEIWLKKKKKANWID